MNSNNTIVIISNSSFFLQDIRNMLVLLRDVDKVECLDYFEAEEKIKDLSPTVIIIHTPEDNKDGIQFIKKLRSEKETKDVPIILYPDLSSTDYIAEAYDAGISDIISSPIKDYELIIRVIWAIQRSEAVLRDKVKNKFFAELGIIDNVTGFCKEDFSIKYLKTFIEEARENKQNSCLVLIKMQPILDIKEDKEKFIQALKESVRTNDIICQKDEASYYIYLSKSKLNGIYSVYERIITKLNSLTAISASAVEIKDEIFEDIINVLNFSIENAPANSEIAIVTEQDFIKMYDDEEDRLEIAKIFKEEAPPENITLQEEITKQTENEDEKVDLGIKIMQEKMNEIGIKKEEAIKETKKIEEDEIDERNIVTYKQTWAKKLSIVVEPLLKKYAAKFQGLYPTLDANINVSPNLSFMKFDKDDITLDLEISYNGIKTIKFDITVKALTSKLDSDSFELEVMDFDYQKFDIILKTLTDEYKNYISEV